MGTTGAGIGAAPHAPQAGTAQEGAAPQQVATGAQALHTGAGAQQVATGALQPTGAQHFLAFFCLQQWAAGAQHLLFLTLHFGALQQVLTGAT